MILDKFLEFSDAQAVTETTRHLKKGKHSVHFTPTKILAEAPKNATPQHNSKI